MIYNLTRVSKQFRNGMRTAVALRDVSVEIGEGEHVALLGPSGSGKSTLFRIMNGSIFPSSGLARFREQNISDMGAAQLRAMRRNIGSVYQQHYLVPGMTALANTMSGAIGRWSLAGTLMNLVAPNAREVERAEHCLEAVGLKEKRGWRCEHLSGGQQQRLAIARTLMQDPEVLLADEPIASLDPTLSDEILELLLRLANERRRTLIISLHRVDLARRYLKRIVALRDGAVAFDANSRELDEQDFEQLYRNVREPHQPREAEPCIYPPGGSESAACSQGHSCSR